MVIASLVLGILVCFGMPIVGVLLIKKRRNIPVGRVFLVGALAFIISQICIRLPILQLVLPQMGWYTLLQYQPLWYGLFIGITAGLFEEGARLLAMHFFLKKRWSQWEGIVFGLGHGGIEAMLLVGVNYIGVLLLVLTGSSLVGNLEVANVLSGVVERIFAVTFHVGASLLVMQGVKCGKGIRSMLLAVLMHTLVDSMTVIGPQIFNWGTWALEGYVAVGAVVTLGLGIASWRRRDEK